MTTVSLWWYADRMPVILRDEAAINSWFNDELSGDAIQKLTQPYESPDLVSKQSCRWLLGEGYESAVTYIYWFLTCLSSTSLKFHTTDSWMPLIHVVTAWFCRFGTLSLQPWGDRLLMDLSASRRYLPSLTLDCVVGLLNSEGSIVFCYWLLIDPFAPTNRETSINCLYCISWVSCTTSSLYECSNSRGSSLVEQIRNFKN